MFKQIQKDLGGVDVCINNVGLLYCVFLLFGSIVDWKNMLDVKYNLFFCFYLNLLKVISFWVLNFIRICFFERERE